jgi:hypothetical protein
MKTDYQQRYLSVLSSGITIVILTLIFSSTTWADPPAATFNLVGADIKLENGASDGYANMMLNVDGLGPVATRDKAPKISDARIPNQPAVTVALSAAPMQAGNTSQSWLISVTVQGLLRNTSQKRYLLVSYAETHKKLEYTLTNRNEEPFTWTIKQPPSALAIQTGSAIEVGVAVGSTPASNVKLLQSTIVEQSRKYPLATNGLMLCREPTGVCLGDINLAANSSSRLWLRPSDGNYPPGHFIGNVAIAATEKPTGETLSLDLYSTRTSWQTWGVVMILLGVSTASGLTYLGRPRLRRNEMLLLAVYLREKINKLKTILAQPPDSVDKSNATNTIAKLDNLLHLLMEDELDRVFSLPPDLPSPIGTTRPTKTDEYNKFIEGMNKWTIVLEQLVQDGITWFWREADKPSANIRAIEEGIRDVDSILSSQFADVPEKKVVEDKIKSAREVYGSKLTQGMSLRDDQTIDLKLSEQKGLDLIKREMHLISWIFLIVTGSLTTLVGSYILVWSNLGFGLWTDYVQCVFWGFGIPIGTQQILQLTSTSVSSSLGIQVPK